jgi:hypothetical protein
MKKTTVLSDRSARSSTFRRAHRLEGEVEALVGRLEAAGVEQIERALKVEVVAREEMTHHEAMDLLLVLRVMGLEVVAEVEVREVEAVGRDEVGGAPEQVRALLAGDRRHGREDVGLVGANVLGAAANCSLVGYKHKAFVGINVDAAAVPDLDMLAGCIREGFDAVIALGDVS